MNNETQPTPEQLVKWREEAKFAYGCDNTVSISSDPYTAYIAGFVHAKQENEQFMKLAKFGAMVAISYVNGVHFIPVHVLDNLARDYGVVDSAFVFTSDTKTTIKELLNDN